LAARFKKRRKKLPRSSGEKGGTGKDPFKKAEREGSVERGEGGLPTKKRWRAFMGGGEGSKEKVGKTLNGHAQKTPAPKALG